MAVRTDAPARGLLGPTLIALAAFLMLVGLGTWQLERKVWKEALIASLERKLDTAPAALPAPETWQNLDPVRDEFRRVRFVAAFQHDQESLVYAVGSSLRTEISGPAYWAFTPARLSGGTIVVINRGAVPEGRQNPGTRAEGQVAGPIEITGVMRWPEQRSFFTPTDDPQRNLWFVRDHQAMAATKGFGPVAPFYIEQEAPPVPGGLPRVGVVRRNLPNNHLQYAFIWFALAAALAVIFVLWVRARRREGRRL